MVQTLNGKWNYRIGKGAWEEIDVPFSRLPVGHSECSVDFDLKEQSDKIFLKFDGVTYYGKVFLNGNEIGEMGPYCEYCYDVSDIVKQTGNSLRVELEDIQRAFGPTAGWENYGGIIRDVSIVYKNESYIDDVFFHSKLLNNYTDAEFVVETKAVNCEDCEFEVSLSYQNKEVLSYIQKTGETVAKNLSGVKLWSLETPNLYNLKVRLIKQGVFLDGYSCNVGFREIYCDRHRFVFNGKPLFLKGVCKHEMIADSGHCPSVEQMEMDMQMIKNTGCNFVRLVHYPHNKKILEIADKLGLMVSEEPGLWWSDTSNPEVSAGSIEVLKRTIMRDRNHPCIMFWLCFNECEFTEQFLIDSANACREYDPTRMVSGANCMNNEDTLKYYNACGFDFYTMHPYAPTMERAKESAKILFDKPLLFTEWGGYYVYNNEELLLSFMHDMHELYASNSDEGAIAGAFFWFWAELNDFNRGIPQCKDGNLHEGLVNKDREKTAIYDAFCRGLNIDKQPLERTSFWIEKTPEFNEIISPSKMLLANEATHFNTVFTKFADEARSLKEMRPRNLKNGPVLKGISSLLEIPMLVDNNGILTFKGGYATTKLSFFGMTDFLKGYPISGEYGEDVADIIINYEEGTTQTYTLKNGIDVTTVFGLKSSSRINPISEKSVRIARFGYDRNFENYILNRLDVETNSDSKIKDVAIKSCNNGYGLLIYGILSE